jgi:integrase
VKRKTENERRVVEPWEYRDLVHTLLNPPPCHRFGSRKAERSQGRQGRQAQLRTGTHGFTCHSFRHTAITHWMEVTGNDAGTVMKWSSHKTLESFSVDLRPRLEGRILATQAMSNVDGILTAQGSVEDVRSDGSANKRGRKPLQNKQVAV